MKALYWIKSDSYFSRSYFKEKLDAIRVPYSLEVKSEQEMFLETEYDISSKLEGILITILENEGSKVSALKTHNRGPLAEKCVNESLSYYPNSSRYISDILLKELSFGNYSSFPLLSAEFKNIDSDLLLTIGTYIREECSINSASEALFIHRNTCRYRLKEFERLTNLDVHSYHDILLLELYFQLGRKTL